MPPADALPTPADDWALFLDVDGTLIEIAPTPSAAHPAPRTGEILGALSRRFGGALALVSGRPIATLDRLFPLNLCCAGLHGLERRGPDGDVVRTAGVGDAMDAVRREVEDFAATSPGLLVEDKGLTVAMHYRTVPEREAEVRRFAGDLVQRLDHGLMLQHGKRVVEFRPDGPDKGDVVELFMATKPFAGRVPVFIGDDVTDEDGFAAVNRMGGHSIRVGASARSAARYSVADVAALLAWLGTVAAGVSTTSGSEIG